MELAPDSSAIRDTLAWALHANGHHAEAIKASEKALELADDASKAEYQDYLDRLIRLIEEAKTPATLPVPAAAGD